MMKGLFAYLLALSLWAAPALGANQAPVQTPTTGPHSATDFTTNFLNPALLALFTCNWGPGAPVNGPGAASAQYQCWFDTSASPAVALKFYDGSQFVTFATFNTTTHTWAIQSTGIGGSAVALSSLGIRSSGAAFDIRFAATEVLTANRTLTWVLGDASRSFTMGGNFSSGGAVTFSGGFGFTGTLTGTTNVTFPTTGTLFVAPAPTRAGDLMYWSGSAWVTLPGNNSGTQFLQENASGVPSWVTVSGTGTVTQVICGALLTGGTITTSGTCAVDKATSANLEAGTADKVLTADNIYDAEKTITFSATQTLDFSAFLNARLTLTANITSLTCSNIKHAQSGVITLVQDGTGSRTMVAAWCSQFRWTTGLRGVLSTVAGTNDALYYQCPVGSSPGPAICYVSLGKAQAN